MPIILPLILGFLSSTFALLFEVVFASFFFVPDTALEALTLSTGPGLFLFAFAEEAAKVLFIWRGRNLIGKEISFLSFGLLFGGSFAFLEYFLIFFMENPWSVAALGILAIHLITSVLLAYLLWKSPTVKRLLFGFVLATLGHFLYNVFLLSV